MKREAQPNRTGLRLLLSLPPSLPPTSHSRPSLLYLSSFTNGPWRAHSPRYQLNARPQLLLQPLPFQRDRGARAAGGGSGGRRQV